MSWDEPGVGCHAESEQLADTGNEAGSQRQPMGRQQRRGQPPWEWRWIDSD